MGFLSTASSILLHWAFPQTCCHCREDLPRDHPKPLCLACERGLRPAEPPFCSRCGDRVRGQGTRCPSCAGRAFACGLIRPAFSYGGPASSLVHAFKYRSRSDAARFCGREMARALARLPEVRRFDLLVPVPLHPSRLRERGYNQALLLAREVSTASGRPVAEPLSRRFATKPQWNLGRSARRANLSGSFAAARGSMKGLRVLLVDDVCTTSATLEECAKALRRAGAASVNALVFARQSLKA